jgi:hypothetical protein
LRWGSRFHAVGSDWQHGKPKEQKPDKKTGSDWSFSVTHD